MGSIEQKAASSAATGTGTGSAQTRTQERVPPPVVLTPWDPTDEGQFGRMYEQRVACTWGYDEVEEWKERMLGGQKVLYWIVSLPPGQHSSSISFLLFFSRSLSLCRSRSRCCSPDCCRCRGHHFLLSSLAFDVSRSEASSGGPWESEAASSRVSKRRGGEIRGQSRRVEGIVEGSNRSANGHV